ncbi:Inositol-tetrakisphosphate 1-kinase [Homalodisca vitripennis]|nr:Inositol-tetrakisphosphate 1-kinase [Homalodisca vitripennis]
MMIIFNESGLADCKPPCVAQTFVNHNAVLFKIYVVGDKYRVVERPSLKNFYASNQASIHFDSHDVSKPDSTSSLTILDPEDMEQSMTSVSTDPTKLAAIVEIVTERLGMSLLGIDVVVENSTGRHAIIDVNSYPISDLDVWHELTLLGGNGNLVPFKVLPSTSIYLIPTLLPLPERLLKFILRNG